MFEIVTSCNGILCLCAPSKGNPTTILICNSITGEFIEIPGHSHSGKKINEEDNFIHISLKDGF